MVLFFVAMPLKYIADMPAAVKYTGWTHGLLFVAYIFLAIMLKIEQNWSWKKFMIICIASLVPFGTFYIENKYFKNTAV